MKTILKNKLILVGGITIFLVVVLVLLAPVLTNGDYSTVDLVNKQMAPCKEHFFGTDAYGRDVWTRVLYGGRISLLVAVGATCWLPYPAP